jgi:mannose-6-phosphate isomerase-like protein (cupin superfamily)
VSRADSRTWTVADAEAALEESGAEFVTLFRQGTLEVEIYRPVGVDRQQPHDKDELYVVIGGSGTFVHAGERTPFRAGDTLFVRAGIPHRFEDFTPDFSTWVFFWGPKGGE